jgi:glutamyl-tRNA synthetase
MTQIDNHTQQLQNLSPTGKPRLRFAPSPTGFQHIGGFRTALFSWLHARHSAGQFILRIEDTDTARTVDGAVDDLIKGLKWFGMDYDEGPIIGGPYGPYYQVQRKALYQQYGHQLIASGRAYRCYCTPERLDQMRKEQQAKKLPPRYDRHCRYLSPAEHAANEASGLPWTVRFAMPLDGETVVHDHLHGDMTFKNSDLNDMVIIKSDGLALYHLAHIVDDHLMGITHVLRAEEWISSSPLHVQIYTALGWPLPLYYHVPDVLGKDKKKLSKRRNAPSWSDFQREGYLPEAVFNFMALLGWSYDDKTEFFTRDELVKVFSLDRVGISGGIYDPDKLLWMNGVYIRQLPLNELVERTLPYLERPAEEGGLPDSIARPLNHDYTTNVLRLEQERMKTLGDVSGRIAFFYLAELTYSPAILIEKGMDSLRTKDALLQAHALLTNLETWDAATIKPSLLELVKTLGLKTGQLLGSLRSSVSGLAATPPLPEMLEVLGRDMTLQRIEKAIEHLS